MGGVDSQILQRLSSENPLKHINGDHNTRLLLIVVSWEGKQVRRRSYSEKMFRKMFLKTYLEKMFRKMFQHPQ